MTEGGEQRAWDKRKLFGGPRSRKESLSQSDLQGYVTVSYQIYYAVEFACRQSAPRTTNTSSLTTDVRVQATSLGFDGWINDALMPRVVAVA